MIPVIISVIGVLISLVTAFLQYRSSRKRLRFEIIWNEYAGDMIYMSVLMNNSSSTPISVTSIKVKNSNGNGESYAWEHEILKSGDHHVFSDALPINVPAYQATQKVLAVKIDKWDKSIYKIPVTITFETTHGRVEKTITLTDTEKLPDQLSKIMQRQLSE